MEDRSSRRLRTLVSQMAPRGLSGNEIARALISMMAGSTSALQSEAGYIDGAPVKTGKEEVVKVHCDEGVATHIGPEPCADIREDTGEYLANRLGPVSWLVRHF